MSSSDRWERLPLLWHYYFAATSGIVRGDSHLHLLSLEGCQAAFGKVIRLRFFPLCGLNDGHFLHVTTSPDSVSPSLSIITYHHLRTSCQKINQSLPYLTPQQLPLPCPLHPIFLYPTWTLPLQPSSTPPPGGHLPSHVVRFCCYHYPPMNGAGRAAWK